MRLGGAAGEEAGANTFECGVEVRRGLGVSLGEELE